MSGIYNFPYQKASFRGATFAVFDAEVLFGRRNVLHEYPLRDEPYAEDLGRKAREYTINAFVIGKDLRGARNALMKAIEDNDTPGTLIHPTLGSLSVVPKDCRIRFNNREGGIEYFTLTFVEAGSGGFPSASPDTSFFSGLFSSLGVGSFINFFSSVFNVFNQPDFMHADSLKSLVGSSGSPVGNIGNDFVSQVQRTLKVGSFGSDNADYTKLNEKLTKFQASASSDLYDPSTLGQKISDIITGMSDVYLNQPTTHTGTTTKTFLASVKPSRPEQQALAAQIRLQTYGDTFVDIPLTTASRIQQAINQRQMINLIKCLSICEMIRVTSIVEYSSRQDAITIRDTVDKYITPELLLLADSGDDEPYLALNKARAAMIKDINTRAATLKNKKYVMTADSMPVIAFAYDQYEDATKDDEIIRRNRIRNPVFIPPLSSVEILV